jgi:hypothetical protein
MLTTYDRAIIEGKREAALIQLEAKFGALRPEVRQRVEAFSPEQVHQLLLDLLKSQSLNELNLED